MTSFKETTTPIRGGTEVRREYDYNDDGVVDRTEVVRDFDYNNDGTIDNHVEVTVVKVDLNGDGQTDDTITTTEVDRDGDGKADHIITRVDMEVDSNSDGVADTHYTDIGIDTDGDGNNDSEIHQRVDDLDTDNDGKVDGHVRTSRSRFDDDDDGTLDRGRDVTSYDDDGDGNYDRVTVDGPYEIRPEPPAPTPAPEQISDEPLDPAEKHEILNELDEIANEISNNAPLYVLPEQPDPVAQQEMPDEVADDPGPAGGLPFPEGEPMEDTRVRRATADTIDRSRLDDPDELVLEATPVDEPPLIDLSPYPEPIILDDDADGGHDHDDADSDTDDAPTTGLPFPTFPFEPGVPRGGLPLPDMDPFGPVFPEGGLPLPEGNPYFDTLPAGVDLPSIDSGWDWDDEPTGGDPVGPDVRFPGTDPEPDFPTHGLPFPTFPFEPGVPRGGLPLPEIDPFGPELPPDMTPGESWTPPTGGLPLSDFDPFGPEAPTRGLPLPTMEPVPDQPEDGLPLPKLSPYAERLLERSNSQTPVEEAPQEPKQQVEETDDDPINYEPESAELGTVEPVTYEELPAEYGTPMTDTQLQEIEYTPEPDATDSTFEFEQRVDSLQLEDQALETMEQMEAGELLAEG